MNTSGAKPRKRWKRRLARYTGVNCSPNGTFEVRVPRPGTTSLYIGAWPTEREAAIVQDRVRLHLGLKTALNFPKLSPLLGPISPDAARGLSRPAMKPRGATGRYVGVFRVLGGWEIRLSINDRSVTVGLFATERTAAIARDRLVLGSRSTLRFLNFPTLKLEPASLEEIRREVPIRRKSRSRHGYFGVGLWERNKHRPWGAKITVARRTVMLGSWPTARAAAEAHDRAARYYGASASRLNFPDRAKDLAPADARTIRAEAKRLRKRSSQYVGVSWGEARHAWIAQVRGRDGRTHNLGAFRTEKEAAVVRDREAMRLLGARAQLNFDPVTGRRLVRSFDSKMAP